MSRNEFTIYIKNLETGEVFADAIPRTQADAVWAADNKTIFYTAKNPLTLLSEKIKRHMLGSNPVADVVVYTETDPSNYIGVGKTKSDKYILIGSQATLSSEYRMIPVSYTHLDVYKRQAYQWSTARQGGEHVGAGDRQPLVCRVPTAGSTRPNAPDEVLGRRTPRPVRELQALVEQPPRHHSSALEQQFSVASQREGPDLSLIPI